MMELANLFIKHSASIFHFCPLLTATAERCVFLRRSKSSWLKSAHPFEVHLRGV